MLFAGIDWGDKALDYHLRDDDGHVLVTGQVEISHNGVADLCLALERHATPDQIAIATETKHGAWIQALLDRGYPIYPVNPKCIGSFREAMTANGDKSDPIDSEVQARYLCTLHDKIRPLRPDAPEIIALRVACQDRVALVDERTAKLNELNATLKMLYRPVLSMFGKLNSNITLEFLMDFPTLQGMQDLTERRLRSWLRRHHYTATSRIPEMVDLLKAPALPVPQYLQTAKTPRICYLAKSLIALNTEIDQRERQTTKDFNKLPEANCFGSLPGTAKTLQPALLACFGRDTERFETPADAQAFMGTAPVTKISGKLRGKPNSGHRNVHFRRGCWKFARRTLGLFAKSSLKDCPWAAALYQKQRDSGHSYHQALRAVAHKWVKIILAMQRTGTPYNEAIHAEDRRRYLSNKEARSHKSQSAAYGA